MTARRSAELMSEIAGELPPHEAQRLLMAVTGRSRSEVLQGALVDPTGCERFERLVARRVAGEPLQYLEGSVEFGPVELAIDSRALVPRPETEQLWELAVNLMECPRVIVDMCCGSGNLALALKYSFPDAAVHGCDASADALNLARENGARTDLDVAWWLGDLFGALPPSLRGTIGLLVANPPYVTVAEYQTLPADVRDHEPREALVAGPLGTEVIVAIGSEAASWLAPGGVVVCEIGEQQGDLARAAFREAQPEVRRDLAGRDRFVVGRRGPTR